PQGRQREPLRPAEQPDHHNSERTLKTSDARDGGSLDPKRTRWISGTNAANHREYRLSSKRHYDLWTYQGQIRGPRSKIGRGSISEPGVGPTVARHCFLIEGNTRPKKDY